MLTAVILSKNEGSRIAKTIQSLMFCDRVLVIDDESSDDTVSHAKKAGAHVLIHGLKGDFAAQRNYADSCIDSGWILHIDADEVVHEELAHEIQSVAKCEKKHAYFIKRQDIFLGKSIIHGEIAQAFQKGFIRLYPKHSGRWVGSVHEVYVPTVDASTLNHHLVHTPHKTLTDFLQHINFYSTLRAQELQRLGIRAHIVHILIWPLGKFCYTFFIKRGILDGTEGFIYSFMMSFHSFLVRAKLHQLYQSKHTLSV